MSTRGAIARYTGEGFAGVYHHWDSYPEGLGATLWDLYHGVFSGDLTRMLKALIDEHPAGWSTINGADWSLPAGYHERDTGPCAVCGRIGSASHYRQYLKDKATEQDKAEMARGNYRTYNHDYKEVDRPKGPECYCHGGRAESANVVTADNAGAIGVEYVYAFDEKAHKMHILSSYDSASGAKMVGMFGMGDPDSLWAIIATVDLRGQEPDWSRVQNAANAPLGAV